MRLRLLPIFAVISVLGVVLQFAEDPAKKLDWPEAKAARFKGKPTDDEKTRINEAIPKSATKTPLKERRVLMIDRCEGFVHSSIPHGNYAVEGMAKTGAYTVDLIEDYSGFTKENLAKYDAILFNNTTHLKPDANAQAAILEFVKSGKGIVGIHAAGDNFKSWEDGVRMIGGDFNGHPWGGGGNWAFKLDDPEHPLNAAFKKEGFWHSNEIYWYRPENFQGRERLRVLLSLDMSKEANQKAVNDGDLKKAGTEDRTKIDVPVSWIQTLGEGRVFYTNLGHREDTFWNPAVLQHILDGIQYALGDFPADATPSKAAGEKSVVPLHQKHHLQRSRP